MKKQLFYRLTCILILAGLISACAGAAATPTATLPPPPTNTPVPPTATPEPTATATLVPTDTLEPTATATLVPTSTATSQPMPPEAAFILISDGNDLYKLGDFEGAKVLCSEALKHEMPSKIKVAFLSLRARTYYSLGDYKSAITDYQQATEAGSQDPENWNMICWIYGITAQPELALPYCEKAVSAAKDAVDAAHILDSRGLVYAQLGRINEAIADFQVFADELKNKTNPYSKKTYAERQKWLKELQAGWNPITPEVLTKLREEETKVSKPAIDPGTQADRTRSAFVKSVESLGFVFSELTEVNGQETVTGKMTNGSCTGELVLIGPQTAISEASLQLTGCKDTDQLTYTSWFVGQILFKHPETIQAVVWLTTDLYYVIEGKQTEIVTKEIGDVTFSARVVPGTESVFEITAKVQE